MTHGQTAPTSTTAPNQATPTAPGQIAPTSTTAPTSTSAPGQTAQLSTTAPPPTTFAPGQTATLTMRSKQAHGGFVEDLDCSACHTSDGWGLAATAGKSGFDHDRTGFPLRGSHIQTTCSGCHTAKGKPATTCEGCHRDPHEGRNDGTCAECHTAVAWSDTKTLDQHRRTRMPLTGAHASVDCAACHKRQAERVYSDTPSDCYSCHREDYRKVNPQIHHLGDQNGPFTRECGTCHQTTAWKPAYAVPTMMARTLSTADHDAVFALSTGSHKAFECSSCHVDSRRAKAVRCDGCHTSVMLRTEHARPVAAVASGCLRCHPRGAPR